MKHTNKTLPLNLVHLQHHPHLCFPLHSQTTWKKCLCICLHFPCLSLLGACRPSPPATTAGWLCKELLRLIFPATLFSCSSPASSPLLDLSCPHCYVYINTVHINNLLIGNRGKDWRAEVEQEEEGLVKGSSYLFFNCTEYLKKRVPRFEPWEIPYLVVWWRSGLRRE